MKIYFRVITNKNHLPDMYINTVTIKTRSGKYVIDRDITYAEEVRHNKDNHEIIMVFVNPYIWDGENCNYIKDENFFDGASVSSIEVEDDAPSGYEVKLVHIFTELMYHKKYNKNGKNVLKLSDITRDSSPIIITQLKNCGYEYIDELEDVNVNQLIDKCKFVNKDMITNFVECLSELGVMLRFEDIEYYISCNNESYAITKALFDNKEMAWNELVKYLNKYVIDIYNSKDILIHYNKDESRINVVINNEKALEFNIKERIAV